MTWNSQPLFHSSVRKWGYLKANKTLMELYLNREIESYNDKEFPLEAIYSMCQQTNKWSEDTTNIEKNPETAPHYGKFSIVYKTRLPWTSWTGVNVSVNFGKNDFLSSPFACRTSGDWHDTNGLIYKIT